MPRWTGGPALAALTLALAAASACLETRQIGAPPDVGARSIIVVFFRGAEPFVFAADIDTSLERSLPPFSSMAGGVLPKIVVLEYGCPLSAIGLQPGEQTLTSERPTAFAPPIAAFERAPGSAGAEWARRAEVAPDVLQAIGRVRPMAQRSCPELKRVETMGDLALGIGLADGSVFVSTKRRLFYQVSLTEGPKHIELREYTFLAAHRAGDRLYLAAERGEIFSVTLAEPSYAPVSGLAFDRAARLWLTGSNNEGPGFELYRLEEKGQFERQALGETMFSPAGDSTGPRVQRLVNAGVVWVGPGDAVSVGGPHLTRTGGPFGPLVLLRPTTEPDLTTVAFVPELGVIVGDDAGGIYRLEDRLIPLPGAAVPDTVTAIVPLGRGMVIVRRGRIDFYEDGALRPCFEQPILVTDAVHRMPSTSAAALFDDASVIFLTMPDPSIARACATPAH